MPTDRIAVEVVDGVADVRLARPEKMNALDPATFAGLVAAGERLRATPGLRAVVLSGQGRAFCSGLDTSRLGRSADEPDDQPAPSLLPATRRPNGANEFQQAVMVWRELGVPVIAAVHGVAFGGGFQLMLAADIRFVAPDTRLSLMEIKWGLVPDMAAFAILPRLVRDDVARDLTYTGRIFSGEEAERLGLATYVSATPVEDALAYARAIAGRNPHAIRAAKRLLNAAMTAEPATILLQESEEQAALIGSANQAEAVRANLEKRDPVFQD